MKHLIRWLSSLKLGIILIASIAIASVWGSLIAADPKQGVDHAVVKVFSAPWFLVLVSLLAVNLVLCSWDKTLQALALPKRKHFAASREFFKRLNIAGVVEVPIRPEQLEESLRRSFFFVHRDGDSFYVQKGVPGRWGATIIHIGLLLVMGATIIRGLASVLGLGIYDANLIVNEGDVARHYFTRKDRLAPPTPQNLRPHALPFYFKVMDFTVENYPGSSVVKNFRCLVEAGDPNEPQIALLTMSSPFYFQGVKVTLNSYSEDSSRQRPTYLVVDQLTSKTEEVDLREGDLALLSLGSPSYLFLEIAASGSKKVFRILDLNAHRVVQEGEVSTDMHLQSGPFERMIAKAKERPICLVLVRSDDSHFGVSTTSETKKTARGELLAVLYEQGQVADQAWLSDDESTAPLGNHWLLRLHEEKTTRMRNQGEAASLRLWVGRRDNPETSGELVLTSVVALVEVLPNEGKLELTPLDDGSSHWRRPSDSHSPAVSSRFRVVETAPRVSYTVFLGLMYDPALPWFYLGCGVIFFGMALAFSMAHRELWFWYEPESGQLYGGMRFYRRESARGIREFWATMRSASRGCGGQTRTRTKLATNGEDIAE